MYKKLREQLRKMGYEEKIIERIIDFYTNSKGSISFRRAKNFKWS